MAECQVVGREAVAAEAPDRQRGPVERERRDHDVHARAVRDSWSWSVEGAPAVLVGNERPAIGR
jgi:hypothetical protein